jgi:hypothetical protein
VNGPVMVVVATGLLAAIRWSSTEEIPCSACQHWATKPRITTLAGGLTQCRECVRKTISEGFRESVEGLPETPEVRALRGKLRVGTFARLQTAQQPAKSRPTIG